MENNNEVQYGADSQEWHLPNANQTETAEMLSAEYGFDDEYESENDAFYASNQRHDDEDDDQEDDDKNDTDDDDDNDDDSLLDEDGLHNDGWGNIDPQTEQRGVPDPMDPSGPGSAV